MGSRDRGMGVFAGIPLVIRIVQSTGIVRVSVRFFSIILVSSCFLYFEERIPQECLLRQYCVENDKNKAVLEENIDWKVVRSCFKGLI